MTNDYFWAAVYILIGLAAAILHWVKKKYVTRTTNCDLWIYIIGNPKATWAAMSALVMGEIGLSLAHAGTGLSLSEFVAAAGVGYTCDSAINKANDAMEK